MTFEIEIADGIVPDGFEPVAFRCPKAGEAYISGHDVATAEYSGGDPCLILRKTWQWPEWLVCDWIARNENGRHRGFIGDEPILKGDLWDFGNRGTWYELDAIDTSIFPECDWRESLRENPNRKQANAAE